MSRSSVLEWLNENEYRAYPLRLVPGKELIIQGKGRVTLGGYNSVIKGYLVNGVGTEFSKQISSGDVLLIGAFRSDIIYPGGSNSSLYTQTELLSLLGEAAHSYSIIKKNNALDVIATDEADRTVDLTLDSILLDANIIYSTKPTDEGSTGQLLSITPVAPNLVIKIYEQGDFIVANYLTATYPYYIRNSNGSLLVLGQAAKLIKTDLSFSNQYFESSTITIMDGPWQGVTGLSFNTSATLTGSVPFLEGYQVSIEMLPEDNAILFSAGKFYGTPIGCDKLFDTVVSSDCGDIISFINGAEARAAFGSVNLVAGNHISIYPDKAYNRIYVGLTFDKVDICQQQPSRPVTQI